MYLRESIPLHLILDSLYIFWQYEKSGEVSAHFHPCPRPPSTRLSSYCTIRAREHPLPNPANSIVEFCRCCQLIEARAQSTALICLHACSRCRRRHYHSPLGTFLLEWRLEWHGDAASSYFSHSYPSVASFSLCVCVAISLFF